MFYYPLDQDERVALSNKVVSLTRDGIRGEEPKSDKALMFILGGSAALGYMASNDNMTISAYLNQYQGGLQVVNAAVIGWNPTQELARLSNEIAFFKPRVVISYSLFNDINIALHYATDGIHLPHGSPRGFDKLDEIVRDVSGLPLKGRAGYLLENVIPRTTRLLVGGKQQNYNEVMSGEITSALDAAADKFLDNEQVMYHISRNLASLS